MRFQSRQMVSRKRRGTAAKSAAMGYFSQHPFIFLLLGVAANALMGYNNFMLLTGEIAL